MKKFKLMLTRGLILTLLAIFTNTFLMAQSRYSEGNGTAANPYQISNISEWNAFANAVSNGTDYSEMFFKLTADITINVYNDSDTVVKSDKIAGYWNSDKNYKPFSGTFDGNGHTLTFNVGLKKGAYIPGANGKNSYPSAPFRVIDGATIKNLHVVGKIVSTRKFNSGFVGFAYSKKYNDRDNIINNCTSSIVIDCSNIFYDGESDQTRKYDCSSGGFVCENKKNSDGNVDSKLKLTNCIFDGSINKGSNPKPNRVAGVVGYNGNTSVNITYTDCVMAGTIDFSSVVSTFSRQGHITYSGNCLFCANYGDVPASNCTQASTEEPDEVHRKYTVSETDYYVPVTVSPELRDMEYNSTDPMPVIVSYYGDTLVKDTDYTIFIEKENNSNEYVEVSAITGPEGNYRVTITGIGNGFEGSKVYVFSLISEAKKWYKVRKLVKDAPSGGTINLPNDFIGTASDTVIEIKKNLTINLNGHKIDRNLVESQNNGQVLRIYSGYTVTINGPGVITGGFNKALNNNSGQDPNNDAGGIYNMGNLTLNNVTVENNMCKKADDNPGNDAATARGGGIYTGQGSSFTMTGGKVKDNIAKGGGGGVYCYQPTSFRMTNVEISNNDSESKGGGLRIRTKDSDTAYLINCTVKKCRATETDLTRSSDGGGIYMQEGKLYMEGCTIGGAIFNPSDTIPEGNQSAFAGAGFYQGGGITYAKNCTVSYNSAYTEHDKMYGGGICLRAGKYTMDGGTITANHSYRDGGGVFIYQGAKFNVLGNIMINDNFRTRKGAIPEDTSNNAYLDGNAAINIVGPLDPEARIHITGHGIGGVYTTGWKEYASLDNFVTDGKYQLMNEWDTTLTEIKFVPYDWYQEGAWDATTVPHETPTASSYVKINRAFELLKGQIGYADSIEFVTGRLILRDGAQLVCYNQATDTPIEALIEKSIKKVDGDDYGWYTITAPIDNVLIKDEWEHSTNLITSSKYDLLRYDEPTHFWDSYSDGSGPFSNNFKNTEKGRGYLYRNEKNVNLNFQGNIDLGGVSVNVTAKGGKLTGFNLIGNPYTHNIFKGEGAAIPNGDLLQTGFYTLTREGVWQVKNDNVDTIHVCQGILVKAVKDGTINMVNTIAGGPSSKSKKNSVMFTVANSKYEDVAYALLDNGYGLDKIEHINDKAPMVYIRQNYKDYAIATIGDKKLFNLCFKAKTTGRYTLKVKPDGEFKYLHIVDCLTDEDIDMLKKNEYTFFASTADDENRFVVLLGENAVSDDFAYQNGDDLIVYGEGELQIFDVAGRMVSRQFVSGLDIVRKPSKTGVYVLRLVGKEIKTQKIVVR